MNPVVGRGDIFASSPTKFKIDNRSKWVLREGALTDRNHPVKADMPVEIGGWEPQVDSAPVEATK